MAASDSPWDFPPSDYSPEQWARACLIDKETGDPGSKDRYALPVKEPSGALNRNGVHAAAGRLNQVQGVSAEKKAAAARKLVSLYHEIGEDPPDHLTNMAGEDGGRSAQPAVERLYVSSFIREGSPIEVRARADGSHSHTIGGYASVFDKASENLGGFIEKVGSTAFNRSRSKGWPGVVCRFNHQDEFLLGTTRSGTLRLTVDNVGLGYEVDLPQCRGDVFEMVQRGDLAHSSFAFQTYEDDWSTNESGFPVRNLVSAKLMDVAPVTTPAYPDATVGLRSLARFVGAPMEDVVKRAENNELRGFFVRTDGDGQPKTVKKPPKSARLALMETLAKRPDDPIDKTA